MNDAKNAVTNFFKAQKENKSPQQPSEPKPPRNPTKAHVVQFAGCHDTQTSADASINGHASGAMSWGLLQVLNQKTGQITYLDVLKETRGLLQGKYSQIPQMSSGKEMDVKNGIFSLI